VQMGGGGEGVLQLMRGRRRGEKPRKPGKTGPPARAPFSQACCARPG
jgi:hypothetical protein